MFSLLFPYICYGTSWENLLKHQDISSLVITSLTLLTCNVLQCTDMIRRNLMLITVGAYKRGLIDILTFITSSSILDNITSKSWLHATCSWHNSFCIIHVNKKRHAYICKSLTLLAKSSNLNMLKQSHLDALYYSQCCALWNKEAWGNFAIFLD